MLSEELRKRIEATVGSDRVVLFMKGNRSMPQCGFSATVVRILDEVAPDYTTVDVLSDPELRQGIKEYSTWPTIPQLYVGGEFVGGCDIVRELYGSGELHAKLGVPVPERKVPRIHLSERAAAFLRDAVERAGTGQSLHLRVDASWRPQMYLGPDEPGEIEAEAGGVSIRVDLPTGHRADGIRVEYVQTPQGHDLRIDNPNAPPGQPA